MNSLNKRKINIAFNAPATLVFCLICLAAMILNIVTGGAANRAVFSVYRSLLLNPMTYVRLVAHVFGHANWGHFFGNIMLIMILGPLLEEKYGTSNTIFLMLATALATGLLSVIFYPRVSMLGASGVVFAMILLASFTRTENGAIPLTFILVAALYIGQQTYEALTSPEQVAYISHLGGGCVGAVLGFALNKIRRH